MAGYKSKNRFLETNFLLSNIEKKCLKLNSLVNYGIEYFWYSHRSNIIFMHSFKASEKMRRRHFIEKLRISTAPNQFRIIIVTFSLNSHFWLYVSKNLTRDLVQPIQVSWLNRLSRPTGLPTKDETSWRGVYGTC